MLALRYFRHFRACPGNPDTRLCALEIGMPGSSPGMAK